MSIGNLIKLALISLVILFLTVTIISLFFPSTVRISKAINIKTNKQDLWQEVGNLKNWQKWNPFLSDLEHKKVEYLDTNNGIWNALKVETTSIKWQEKNADLQVAVMQNEGHRPVLSGWRCLQGQQDSITVQWYMDFKLGWLPWEKFGSLLLEKKYGFTMERGLMNLKAALEK